MINPPIISIRIVEEILQVGCWKIVQTSKTKANRGNKDAIVMIHRKPTGAWVVLQFYFMRYSGETNNKQEEHLVIISFESLRKKK